MQIARWDIRHHIYGIWKIYLSCKTFKTVNKSRENSVQLNIRKEYDVGHHIIPIYTANIVNDMSHVSKIIGLYQANLHDVIYHTACNFTWTWLCRPGHCAYNVRAIGKWFYRVYLNKYFCKNSLFKEYQSNTMEKIILCFQMKKESDKKKMNAPLGFEPAASRTKSESLIHLPIQITLL